MLVTVDWILPMMSSTSPVIFETPIWSELETMTILFTFDSGSVISEAI